MDVPFPLTYGKVVGRFVHLWADTADLGDIPDEIPATGYVTFMPEAGVVRGPISDPPFIGVKREIKCPIVRGWLCMPGTEDTGTEPVEGVRGVNLVASDSPGVQPSPMRYQVTFYVNNATVQPPEVVIEVPGSGVLDLATAIPSDTPGVITVVTEESRYAAEAAAAEAAQTLLEAQQAMPLAIATYMQENPVPDATTELKGLIQIAGDLSGTADAPTVPGLQNKADTEHTHAIADTEGLQDALDSKQPSGDYALGTHQHTIADTDGLQDALDSKQPSGDYALGTHQHASTQISDWAEAVQDTVAAMLTSGANVTLTYDDDNGTVTITAAGDDAEAMRDTIGAALVGVNGVNVSVNDAADTITISISGLTIAQVTGLQDALDSKQPVGDYSVVGHAHDDLYYTETEADARFVRTVNGSTPDVSGNATVGTDAEAVRDVIAAALAAGAGVTITPDDAGDTISIALNYTDATFIEAVQDSFGQMVTAAGGTYDDATGTITLPAGGGAGGGGAEYLGEYEVGVTYPKDSIVSFDGMSWIASTETSNVPALPASPFVDDFNRPDSDTIGWDVEGVGWSLNSGKAVYTTAPLQNLIQDVGSPNGDFALVEFSTGNEMWSSWAVYLRWADDFNHLIVRRPSRQAAPQFVQVVGGVSTVLATLNSPSSATFGFSASLSGESIVGALDGVQFSVTAPLIGTGFGVRAGSESGNSYPHSLVSLSFTPAESSGWKCLGASPEHTHEIDELSDVDTTGAVSGNVLSFDGTSWVPAAPSSGGGTGASYLGPFELGTSYPKDSIVSFGGMLWIATVEGATATPVIDQTNYSEDFAELPSIDPRWAFVHGTLAVSVTTDLTTGLSGSPGSAVSAMRLSTADDDVPVSATLTLAYTEPGTISFYDAAESEGPYGDYGQFYIDDVSQFTETHGTHVGRHGGRDTSTSEWFLHTFAVPTGTHTFKWTYQVDISFLTGRNSYFIADLQTTGTFPALEWKSLGSNPEHTHPSGEVRSDTSGSFSYIGKAPLDTLESVAGWTVSKIDLVTSPGLTTTASGSWADRLTLTYS